MVPNAIHFLQALSKLVTLDLVLAKPKSFSRPERSVIHEILGIPVMKLTRELGSDPRRLHEVLDGAVLTGQRLALLDIGGYFAHSADALNTELGGTLVGIMRAPRTALNGMTPRHPQRCP
jgi:adenosylhomocysteinase